jgi:hypothetical protein
MPVFIEKPHVTSLNCYKTIKNASILIKHGTNVDRTIASVKVLLNCRFTVTMATGGRFKIAKNHYFSIFFPSILFSMCCVTPHFGVKRTLGSTPKCVKLRTTLWGPTYFWVKIEKLTPKCVNMLLINALWVQRSKGVISVLH